MRKVSRLKRMINAQQRLRMLEELELERSRRDLMDAVAARQHALERAMGNSPPELAWMVAKTNAARRTARHVESACVRIGSQEVKLTERAMTCQLAERLLIEAIRRERAELDANVLSETLEWCAASWDNSVRQD